MTEGERRRLSVDERGECAVVTARMTETDMSRTGVTATGMTETEMSRTGMTATRMTTILTTRTAFHRQCQQVVLSPEWGKSHHPISVIPSGRTIASPCDFLPRGISR
jgi:hypothetical protein